MTRQDKTPREIRIARGRVQLRDSPEKAGSGKLEASAWPGLLGVWGGANRRVTALAAPRLSMEPLLDAGEKVAED